MTRIPGWLRQLRQAIPLLRSHVGRHIDAFLDLDWADQLHGMRERRARNRPVCTPPARQTIRYDDLDCFQPDPRFALELHHEPHRDVVAATLHNPGLLNDIRTERTTNLPGPVATSKNGRAGEPRNLAGPVEQGQGHRAGEPHHRDWTQRPLSVVRDGLAPWVEKALAGAKVGDTVIGPIHDNTPFGQWLEQVTGGDAFDGKGSSDAYVDWLFAGMAGAR